jgi:cytochrome P450
MLAYLGELLARRRTDPRDDLLSFLAGTRLDGKPVPDEELLAFAVLLMVAGNETTRNATSGALLAFLEHPGERERLRRDPALLPSAAEEVLRWTSPVVHFARTATRDCELRGQPIRAGDALALFYASANRDEAVFEAPFEFRIDRRPNPHLAFGVGEHVCLGAHVARLELRTILDRLLRRLAHAELAGPVERLRSATVGGLKRVPIRYRLTRS